MRQAGKSDRGYSNHSERPYRDYCSAYDHYENHILVLHPELADLGWLSPGIMLRTNFLEDRAKAAGGSKSSGGGSIGLLTKGSPRGSEAGSASGSQLQ